MSNWWEAPEWANKRAMEFGDPPGPDALTWGLALTTEPEMVRGKNGALRLRLRNRHPHERLRIFVGSRQAARC